jgi:ATP-dependent Lhr-like helicase
MPRDTAVSLTVGARLAARVAGLISTGYPGQPKRARQLQISSTLFYAVFRK